MQSRKIKETGLFQSTFPRGERRITVCIPGSMELFQSTFPRGERRYLPHRHDCNEPVSIHVPTRGTTRWSCQKHQRHRSFNPRSHEGNDWKNKPNTIPNTCFNPRSHEGNDIMQRAEENRESSFNPRSHEGNDLLLFSMIFR